jgi:hypothetical protein
MRVPRFALLVLFLFAIAFLAACAAQPAPGASELPGFWLGFVHGCISPFALIAELFTNVRVYAFPNGGGWYDLGFMLGAAGALGGGGFSLSYSR